MSNEHRDAMSSTSRIAPWIALGTAALMAFAGSAGAAEAPKAGTTYINLDGQCDILQLTVFPWHQAGEFATGCPGYTGVGAGMYGAVTGVSPKDLTIAETLSGDSHTTYLFNIQYPLKTGNWWSLFTSTDGVNFFPYNSGSYTIVGAEEARAPHAGPSAHLVPKQ